MKLDMSLSYNQNCNIDQLYNTNNQFVYLNASTATSASNGNQQQDLTYLQRFNNANNDVVDAYYSSYASSTQQDNSCQNAGQSLLNSTMQQTATLANSASNYLNLNNNNNTNKKLKLSLNVNEPLSESSSANSLASTLTPSTPSASNLNGQLNDEIKSGGGMHTTIDFNLIDYPNATLNCASYSNPKQQQQQQQQQQFYSNSNLVQQNTYPIQQNMVQQQPNYSPYYPSSNIMPIQQQQQQQQQYMQLPTTVYQNGQYQEKKLPKLSTNMGTKNMYEEFNSEEDEEEEDDDEDEDDEDDDEYDDDDDSMHKHQHKRMRKQQQIDENDYEIKDGAYLNTYFNSPSSLSSSSNPSIVANTHLDHQRLANKSYQIDHARIKEEKSAKNAPMMVAKTEMCDDMSTSHSLDATSTQIHHQNSLESSESSTTSSSSPLSHSKEMQPHHASNAPMAKLSNQQQAQINQMLNSYSMAGIMNDYDLVNLPLRELNKRLRSLPKQMAYNMKKRRRTLKNRKYAQNCRSKRLEQKSEMEIQNAQLKVEINRLNKMLEKMQKENAMLKCLMAKQDEAAADKDKDKHMICNPNSNGLLYKTASNMQSNANISQLTHLLSMPLANKSSNTSNNSSDHFSYQTKC